MLQIEELNERVVVELVEILLFCETCEHQTLELMKVANCVFTREEFFGLIDAYHTFKSNVVILERLLKQVDAPITMLQVVTVKSIVRELKKNFDQLIEMLNLANTRIDNDEIDFTAAELIHDLLECSSFDVIDYDDFKAVTKTPYFVIERLKPLDEAYNERYGELTLLVIEAFKTRREAYAYALRNGISKDQVWGLYG